VKKEEILSENLFEMIDRNERILGSDNSLKYKIDKIKGKK